MVRDRPNLLRVGLLLTLVGGAASWAASRGWVGIAPAWPLAVTGAGLILTVVAAPFFAPRRFATTDKASLEVAKDGTFTWRPAGESLPTGMGVGATRGLYDSILHARHETRLAFTLPDATPAPVVKKAVAQGTRAVRRHPQVDAARTKAEWVDEPGPLSRFKVHLVLEGPALTKEGAREASEAFAQAFLERIKKKGIEAARR